MEDVLDDSDPDDPTVAGRGYAGGEGDDFQASSRHRSHVVSPDVVNPMIPDHVDVDIGLDFDPVEGLTYLAENQQRTGGIFSGLKSQVCMAES